MSTTYHGGVVTGPVRLSDSQDGWTTICGSTSRRDVVRHTLRVTSRMRVGKEGPLIPVQTAFSIKRLSCR